MAILRGRDGTVSLASQSVGEVKSWSISTEADTLETTSMGSGGWKTFIGSLQSWSGSVEVFLDDDTAVTAGYNTAHDIVSLVTDNTTGAAVALVLTDGTSGNTYTGSAIVTSVSVDVSSADLVTLNLDLTGSGALVIT